MGIVIRSGRISKASGALQTPFGDVGFSDNFLFPIVYKPVGIGRKIQLYGICLHRHADIGGDDLIVEIVLLEGLILAHGRGIG